MGSSDFSESRQHKASLPITPNYLVNPPVAPKIQVKDCKNSQNTAISNCVTDKNMQGFEEGKLIFGLMKIITAELKSHLT